jgi:hypothetical protein
LGHVADVESGTAGLSTGEAFFSIDLVFQDNGIATTLLSCDGNLQCKSFYAKLLVFGFGSNLA